MSKLSRGTCGRRPRYRAIRSAISFEWESPAPPRPIVPTCLYSQQEIHRASFLQGTMQAPTKTTCHRCVELIGIVPTICPSTPGRANSFLEFSLFKMPVGKRHNFFGVLVRPPRDRWTRADIRDRDKRQQNRIWRSLRDLLNLSSYSRENRRKPSRKLGNVGRKAPGFVALRFFNYPSSGASTAPCLNISTLAEPGLKRPSIRPVMMFSRN